ncbi:hypothetical protein LFZ50_14315 [Salmonella enterica subsp. arizonae serovar 53:-:- str. SA20100345]|nr:hypothetical protein LFZ50_14315 [Salmonella enterica subsp. arizonae serovar 53:-:- str. SA20100345]
MYGGGAFYPLSCLRSLYSYILANHALKHSPHEYQIKKNAQNVNFFNLLIFFHFLKNSGEKQHF